MALRSDSYGTVAKIVPYVQQHMRGANTFTAGTIPTLTQVEGMIDMASAVLNNQLKGAGFTTPLNSTNANSTAKLACDSWVVFEVAAHIEATKVSATADPDTNRVGLFQGLQQRARQFVMESTPGWKYEGAALTRKSSDGLVFTGQDAISQRSDPTDNTLAQPKFRRDLHDHDGDLNSTSIWG